MDRRRPLAELESSELITRLNNANSKLNERCTMYKMTLKRKNKAMDDIWKRNTQLDTDNQILQETIDIHQETIDSLASQLAKKEDTS